MLCSFCKLSQHRFIHSGAGTGSAPLFLSSQGNDFCPRPSHTSFLWLKYNAINLINIIYGIKVKALSINVCFPPGLKDEGKIWKPTRSQWDAEVPLRGERRWKGLQESPTCPSPFLFLTSFPMRKPARLGSSHPSLAPQPRASLPGGTSESCSAAKRGACFAKT